MFASTHLLATRYRLESKIGQGGAAAVFCAFDPQMDRAMVVKLFLSCGSV
ncbi:MAG: hypothetical protein HYY33_07945 [Chloroflexi bacterium]|nr:hypothetical protein [Chloroflexota bacterium]